MEREARWLIPMFDLAAGDMLGLRDILREGYGDLGLTATMAERPTEQVRRILQAGIRTHKLIDAHHQYVDGTSVSVAIASSIVAQMLEANASLTPANIKAMLTSTTMPMPDMPAEMQGAGVIDAAAAVQAALA